MTKTTARRASAAAPAARKTGKASTSPARKTAAKTASRPAPPSRTAAAAKKTPAAKRSTGAAKAAPQRQAAVKPASKAKPVTKTPKATARPLAKPTQHKAAPPAAHKSASTSASKPAPASATPVVAAPAPRPVPAAEPQRSTSSARSKAIAKAQAAYEAPAPLPAPTSRFADRFAPPRPPTRQMNHAEVDRELPPVKHDPKLVNAWKSKAGRDLSEAELLAMPQAEYMNDKQLDYFRATLQRLKDDLLSNAGQTTENLREDTSIVPDPADRATIEEEHALELRTRDRERKLLKKISQSLARIESGDYGFCDETGEPIGLGRLLARPTATLSLEAQQRRELKQKMFGD